MDVPRESRSAVGLYLHDGGSRVHGTNMARERITVLPILLTPGIDYANRARDPKIKGLRLRFAEPVLLSAIERLDLAEGPRVALLDCHRARTPATLRAVARLHSAGWRDPIVAILNERTIKELPEIISRGATDVVLATTPMNELAARLVFASDARQKASVPVLRLGDGNDIAIDWRAREVLCGDVRLSLPHRELQLLGAFMDAAGCTLTAEELSSRAWKRRLRDHRSFGAYVSSLRKKLAWFGDRLGIMTIKGRGYRFEISDVSSTVAGAVPFHLGEN